MESDHFVQVALGKGPLSGVWYAKNLSLFLCKFLLPITFRDHALECEHFLGLGKCSFPTYHTTESEHYLGYGTWKLSTFRDMVR